MAAYLFKKADFYISALATPAVAGDAIRAEEITLNFASAETNRRPTGLAAMGTNKTFIGGLEGSITAKFPLKGEGVAAPSLVAPDFAQALIACHMTETTTGGGSPTQIDYTPSNAVPTTFDITVQVPEIGAGTSYEVVLTGCVGNLTLEAERNGPVFAICEYKGVFAEPTNESALDVTGLQVTVAPKFKGTSVTLHGYAGLIIEGFTFDMGNEIAMRPSMAAADGFIGAIMTARSPSGTLNPEIPAISDFDPYTQLTDETIAALDFGVVGSASGNQFAITFPQAQIVGVNLVERAGMLVGDIALDFHEALSATGGTSDDIKIAFT